MRVGVSGPNATPLQAEKGNFVTFGLGGTSRGWVISKASPAAFSFRKIGSRRHPAYVFMKVDANEVAAFSAFSLAAFSLAALLAASISAPEDEGDVAELSAAEEEGADNRDSVEGDDEYDQDRDDEQEEERREEL